MPSSVLMAPWSSPLAWRHCGPDTCALASQVPTHTLEGMRPCAGVHLGRGGPPRDWGYSALPSTAQHPGDLCPDHEDNVLGDILCSQVSPFPF